MQRRFIPWPAVIRSDTVHHCPAQAHETIKVGVTGGPHAQILEVVKKVAAKDGLKIQIVEFADYIQPNAALAQRRPGCQQLPAPPFCDTQIKDRGYKISGRRYRHLPDGHLFEEGQVAGRIA